MSSVHGREHQTVDYGRQYFLSPSQGPGMGSGRPPRSIFPLLYYSFSVYTSNLTEPCNRPHQGRRATNGGLKIHADGGIPRDTYIDIEVTMSNICSVGVRMISQRIVTRPVSLYVSRNIIKGTSDTPKYYVGCWSYPKFQKNALMPHTTELPSTRTS